jgi:hypothetical protein
MSGRAPTCTALRSLNWLSKNTTMPGSS